MFQAVEGEDYGPQISNHPCHFIVGLRTHVPIFLEFSGLGPSPPAAPMRLSKELSRVHVFIRTAVGFAGGGNRKWSSANGTLLGSSLVYDSRWALAAARRRSLRTGSTSRRNQRALVLLDHIRLQRTRHPRG